MKFGTREIAILATVVLTPIASYALVFRPQQAAIKDAGLQVEHQRTMLERLRAETARHDDLATANADIADRVERIEDRLPDRRELDRVLRRVSVLAIEAGLDAPSVKTRRPLDAGEYREQPMEIATTGNFAGFASFLVELEQLPRITRITDLTLSRPKEDAEHIEIAFTLSIYFQDSTRRGEL